MHARTPAYLKLHLMTHVESFRKTSWGPTWYVDYDATWYPGFTALLILSIQWLISTNNIQYTYAITDWDDKIALYSFLISVHHVLYYIETLIKNT